MTFSLTDEDDQRVDEPNIAKLDDCGGGIDVLRKDVLCRMAGTYTI